MQRTHHPYPEIYPQRQIKLYFRAPVVGSIYKGVGVDKLPLLPAPPVPDRLPDQCYCSLTNEEPEERSDNNWKFLDVITVDVDVCE